ncbi:nicotinate (nicotinamide) nucleotide adenylyltransferase [Taibaiella chishuiensis]|uniref:Probable nicotinate-nucleotide adenylyltransferase n=1 Tax=Taibaiella chishuiensis TaxID=1434707 RepID=A0A2P8CWJ2_9BACT|nr:nicotinate (nicotinamide) nucleotide adenylyltransferase [Taibaiella chishuiensis]PSK89335.1 nicotinate-nucleotide adenylyltransferase [Taibaiella chishuiensis]
MNIGLYFGSFNPIHTGHLIIASHVLEHSDLDKIWFVVSPHNPLKESHTLLNEYDRLHLAELAIKNNPRFRVSNVEFHLPKPSYTIDTLAYLSEKFPLEKFTVIMGSDSYQNLPRWKNYQTILEYYKIVVFERPGFLVDRDALPANVSVVKAPLLEISSTHIRTQVKEGRSIRYLVPDAVAECIAENRYYSK